MTGVQSEVNSSLSTLYRDRLDTGIFQFFSQLPGCFRPELGNQRFRLPHPLFSN